MKTTVLALLIVVLVASLIGCSSSDDGEVKTTSASNTSATGSSIDNPEKSKSVAGKSGIVGEVGSGQGRAPVSDDQDMLGKSKGK